MMKITPTITVIIICLWHAIALPNNTPIPEKIKIWCTCVKFKISKILNFLNSILKIRSMPTKYSQFQF